MRCVSIEQIRVAKKILSHDAARIEQIRVVKPDSVYGLRIRFLVQIRVNYLEFYRK